MLTSMPNPPPRHSLANLREELPARAEQTPDRSAFHYRHPDEDGNPPAVSGQKTKGTSSHERRPTDAPRVWHDSLPLVSICRPSDTDPRLVRVLNHIVRMKLVAPARVPGDKTLTNAVDNRRKTAVAHNPVSIAYGRKPPRLTLRIPINPWCRSHFLHHAHGHGLDAPAPFGG